MSAEVSFPKSKAATAIYDDQRVRVIAINDGSGRGTLIFAVIDGFGISSTDVRGIRKELADFAKANNIVGINISVLHQHSCVDTFGMNGDLVKMIFTNPALNRINNTFGTDYKLLNGQNASFMISVTSVNPWFSTRRFTASALFPITVQRKHGFATWLSMLSATARQELR